MDTKQATDYDVIVIGAGGAGLCAAIAAADSGARVALLEAGKRVGGSTALAGGFVLAARAARSRVRMPRLPLVATIADDSVMGGAGSNA